MKANNQYNEPLSEKEEMLFEQLKAEAVLPENLEESVIKSLHSKNLLSKNTNKMTRSIFIGIAASIAALICGFFIGQNFQSNPTTLATMNKYILLLYENDDFNGLEESKMVQEYTQWAIDLSEKGNLDNAEKLADEGQWLGNKSTKNLQSRVSGYFVVLANTYDEALDLAKTHPHVSYGGGIEVRPIEKLD